MYNHSIPKDTPVPMTLALFLTALLMEIAYIILFLLTILRPPFRFWPPPSARSWQFFSAWPEARFGDEYREYKRRVPRWIGRRRA